MDYCRSGRRDCRFVGKHLALKSASDFLLLYESIPDKHNSVIPVIPSKITFLGPRPRTSFEMYEHTKRSEQVLFWRDWCGC